MLLCAQQQQQQQQSIKQDGVIDDVYIGNLNIGKTDKCLSSYVCTATRHIDLWWIISILIGVI